MAVLTGKNGALQWNGAAVGKVRSWSLSVNKDPLETTNLGVNDRTYVPGLRGSTGTAELMYDPDEGQAVSLLNSIFSKMLASRSLSALYWTKLVAIVWLALRF